jgi:ribosome maturation factor RimP
VSSGQLKSAGADFLFFWGSGVEKDEVDPIEQVRAIAERVAHSQGLEIFDIQMRRESIGMVLRVVIDRPAPPGGVPEPLEDSIGIKDCQSISNDLSAVLDVEDVIAHRYTLEVSSPGLDRPLRHAADYRRFAGRAAKLVLREPLDGQTHVRGRLQGTEGDETVLVDDLQGRRQRIPMALVSRGRLEVEF